MVKKKVFVLIVIIMALTMLAGFMSVNAENAALPENFYIMDEQQTAWVGENDILDYVKYTHLYEVFELHLYNAEWAGRYGGVSMKGVGLDIECSPAKNRYIVLSVMPDEISVDNHYDNLKVIYYKKDDPTVNWGNTAKDTLGILHNASIDDYTKVILDLGWEEEFILDTLRLDMFSSSYDKSADQNDSANCGYWYMNYIAFFDTLEDAQNFTYGESEATKPPVNTPETPAPSDATPDASDITEAPSATSSATESIHATQKPAASTPDTVTGKANDGKSPVVAIIIAAVVVVAAAAAIVLLLKGKKNKA